MLPCVGCGYRRTIPGDEHLHCAYDWSQSPQDLTAILAGARITSRTARWFRFPLNYDPTWGPDTCGVRADTAQPDRVKTLSPWEALAQLLR